jgi:hypothetical protein
VLVPHNQSHGVVAPNNAFVVSYSSQPYPLLMSLKNAASFLRAHNVQLVCM